MTLEEVKALSDEELRIKVAELCGWEISPFGSGIICFNEELDKQRAPEDDGIRFSLPDYPHDLNACHEMEKAAEVDEYVPTLYEVITGYPLKIMQNQGQAIDLMNWVYNATARQRCEAFVLTMENANEGS